MPQTPSERLHVVVPAHADRRPPPQLRERIRHGLYCAFESERLSISLLNYNSYLLDPAISSIAIPKSVAQ